MAPLHDLERQSVDCPFPLIPLHLRQAKRKRIEEYVDRLVDLLPVTYIYSFLPVKFERRNP